jgi:hypothetical protein
MHLQRKDEAKNEGNVGVKGESTDKTQVTQAKQEGSFNVGTRIEE